MAILNPSDLDTSFCLSMTFEVCSKIRWNVRFEQPVRLRYLRVFNPQMLLGRLSTHIVLGMERTQLLQQIAAMRQALFDENSSVDFMKLDKFFYKLKGSSGSAKAAFQQLRNEHNILGLGLILTYRY
ncbi:hypothetical protein Patl1_20809 [Pistacia atlantica]|uniref:Uncharacterized protein n=1 Tax=Pistacia atlantica TaxID=434234 RepID=A0ACC1BM25_9ROSI|nr:hypothetical protein Patl1_20809 [Pistacia atlantica]